ncbi:PLxRFG domain-containing protein [Vibrio rhizosphaerae]|uniref:PLxRFG domain-containing protein n=1 Tax=Vibrio rhizosphaerae TaxID=398736 RepID=A0ABU4IXD7_9VIBR|nr:PLxRFG domain-containing protein [Vibrio rhizosphaerae]MDW6094066.1 PLxRFG domain-containing protein [Vibrio rhizosphaerae]
MQDKLLGENPYSTVDARTDMSNDYQLPDGFDQRFSDLRQKRQSAKDYDVSLGDITKAVGTGALGMVAGMGELSEQVFGVGESVRDMAQSGSDYLINSMTDDGKAALSGELFSENDGSLGLGKNVGDIDVWAMKFAQGIGSMAGMMIPGGVAGQAARLTIGRAVASSMIKRGATRAVAEATAAKTVQHIASSTATGAGFAGSHGSAMLDGRQQVMDMDADWLATNSEYFQNSLKRIVNDPANDGMSPTDMVNLAKEETANYVSRTIAGDPAAIASSIAGALGDKLLFGAVTGQAGKGVMRGALKGAITEGATEGIENAGQTYATNNAMNDVAGTNRDPWEGALQNAAEGAAIGIGTGSVPGAIGGFRGQSRNGDNVEEAQLTSDNIENQNEPSLPNDVQQTPDNPENLDIPAYERQQSGSPSPQTEPVGREPIDVNNMDLPAYMRAGQENKISQQVSSAPSMQDSLNQVIADNRSRLKDKGVLSDGERREIMGLARAYDPERAAQIEKELSDPDVYNNPEYASALADEYQQLAQNAKNLEVDPLATSVDQRVANNKRDLKTRNQQLKEGDETPESQSSQLDLSNQQTEYDRIRDKVKSQLLPEDENNDALIDRLTQLEYDKLYNDAPVDRNQSYQPQPYQDKGLDFDKVKSQESINDRALQAKEAMLQAQAENERSQQPQLTPNPNWTGKIDGSPVTRTYQRDQANIAAREQQVKQDETDRKKDQIRERMGRETSGRFRQFNNDAERIQSDMPTKGEVQEIKHQATERQLERSLSGKKITAMSKRLRRRIQRSKGFDTEAVLNEFRHHEKRLQAYQEEARQQAEREANDPENIQRRKSAQALFEEKISSPKANQFKENLIKKAISRVNASIDSTAGTVLEMDGRETSLPEVKKQLENSVRSLAGKFISKTSAINERLRSVNDSAPQSKDQSIKKSEEPSGVDNFPVSGTGISLNESVIPRFDKLHDGNLSLDELKRLSEDMSVHEEQIKDDISSMTIPEINRMMGPYFSARWKGERKAKLVKYAFSELLSDLEFSAAEGAKAIGLTQGSDSKSRAQLINEKISSLSDESYQKYLDARREAKREQAQTLEAQTKAMSNPQTLSDFTYFVKNGGELTPELRAKYDRLITDDVLNKRQADKDSKAIKSGFDSDSELDIGEIQEGVHGKTGDRIFNVSLRTRLGKDKFKEAAAMARSMKGGYWKGNFYFPSMEDAEVFIGWLQGESVDHSDAVNAKQEAKQFSAVEKLKTLGDSLAEKAENELNTSRLENTHKRMQEAENARSRARSDAEMAETMKRLAKKIESGDAKVLSGLNAKTQLETLRSVMHSALYEASSKNKDLVNKSPDSQYSWKDSTTIDQKVVYAKYPMVDTRTKVVVDLANRMSGTPGYKMAGKTLLKTFSGRQNEDVSLNAESEIVHKMIEFAKSEGLYGSLPDMFFRLQRMGITRRELLREALRDIDSVKPSQQQESKLQSLERDLKKKIIGNRNVFVDFFPTPEKHAEHIADLADIHDGMKVLEPSAGNGILADAAKSRGADVDVVELSGDLRNILEEKGYNIVAHDFMDYDGSDYDRVIMNPPFSDNMDIDHVRHAYGMLKPGGRLVAIVSSMAGDRSNKKNKEFKQWLQEHDAVEELDPDGLFKDSMNKTGVRTKTVVIDKPSVKFSRESISNEKPDKGMSLNNAQLAVEQWLKEYRGGAGVKVTVVKSQLEAEKLMGMSFKGSVVHALYRDSTGETIVVADNIENPKQLRQKLRHEILVHHGLKAVVGDSEYQTILQRVHRGRNSPHLKEIWNKIDQNYSDWGAIDQVEEVLAHAAEVNRNKIQQWWDSVVEAIAHALRKVGLMRQSDITKAELNNIVKTLADRTKAVNHWHDPEMNRIKGAESKLSQAKFSQEKTNVDDYVVRLHKAMSSLKSRVEPVKVMDTPDVLKHVGMPELPIYISRDIVRKATNGVKRNHDLDLSVIEELPNLLSDPIAVFRPKNQDMAAQGGKNILVEATNKSGNRVVVAIHGNTQEHRFVVNRVASVYGKESEQFQGWINNGLLEYIKSKNPDWLRLQGLQLPKERTFHQGYVNSVLSKDHIVKAQNTDQSDIKLSQKKKITLDDALARSTPHGRFNGVLNAISRGMSAVRGEFGLGAVTLRQLADLAKDRLPQVSQYVDTVHRMLSRRNQLAFDAHDMADSVRKWMARNRKDADEMFDIAHLATTEGVDPDVEFKSAKEAIEKRIQHIEKVNEGSHKTNEQMGELKELRNMLAGEPRRMKKHAELKRQFDKLPEEAKRHYRAMRDKYKERHDLYKTLLEQQIANAAIDGRIKKARIADLRSQFELQEVMAPYFPLARFGDYWISVADENGEKRFMMFETEKEQQQTKKNLEEQGFQVMSGFKLDKDPRIEGASLGFVVDLISKVDDSKLNELKKGEIKDTIYQMYLQSLPSRSMRKQFMHRKKVKGWSNDALRALAENMVKGSYQLARLEYSDELTKLASETAKAAGVSDDNQSSRYSNELMKRHEWVMNPKHSKVAQWVTSMGFTWMLGFSPAAAAVNISQNFVVALPMMASKFGAMNSSSALAKTTKEFISAKGNIKSKLQDADEIAAFNQWYDSGLLDSTNAHDLAGMAEGQNWKYSPAYEKYSEWMSKLFHKAEVFNRETTALATYRLARKNGISHEGAAKLAEKLTWDAHFDYSNINRARYMQNPAMKVATQFKQYSQNMTYYLMRNAYLSMKGMTPQERSEARKQLVGTLGMTTLLGGLSALPLSLVYGLANSLNAAFGDDDQPWDAETEFKSYLSDVFGSDVADKIIYGAGGAGVSPRISLDGMWIRDPNRDLEGEDTWSFYAQQAAGPVLGGIALQAIKAGGKMLDGDYYRGIEGMTPKIVKDAMKAYRYADEGALNRRGDAYKDDFDAFEIFEQSIGFTPSDLSKQYQMNNARKEYEQHVLERRSNLMTSYYLAWKQSDGQLMLDTQKAISQFNRKYPRLALTSKSIRQSLRTRMRYSQQSSNGVNLNKKLRNFEAEVAW